MADPKAGVVQANDPSSEWRNFLKPTVESGVAEDVNRMKSRERFDAPHQVVRRFIDALFCRRQQVKRGLEPLWIRNFERFPLEKRRGEIERGVAPLAVVEQAGEEPHGVLESFCLHELA